MHEAIDEWVYMLKHSEVKPEFTSKHIQDASEKTSHHEIWMKPNDERMTTICRMYRINNQCYGRRGRKGREEGQQEATFAIARNLLANHVALDIIATSTGLSIEQIQQFTTQ